MTFKDLLTQLQSLSPEQLEQEVIFVKYGACSDYAWKGLAEDGYYEDSTRVQLSVDPEGVWYVDNEYSDGIAESLTAEELAEFKHKEQIVPPNMPFFAISENE